MNYQTYPPHPDLGAIVKFYWTLEVPFDPQNQKQKIVPDGYVEMTFNFGDPIKRYISDTDYILHPNAMVMGQRTQSFFILPEGEVNTFAICFYPIGFANFVKTPLETLVDKETPLEALFGTDEAHRLERQMMQAPGTPERMEIIEAFLIQKLNEKQTISRIVTTTVESLLNSNGAAPIHEILKADISKRRQLERHFRKQIGISPKQLGKAIRLQSALQLLLNKQSETLTEIAYESDYFDQNHFIKDFKELIGMTPKEVLASEHMALSALFYK